MASRLVTDNCHFPHPENPRIYCQLEAGHPGINHVSGDDIWFGGGTTGSSVLPERVAPDPALVTLSRMDYYTLLGLAAAGDHGDAEVNAEGEAVIHKIIDRVKARNG